MTNPALAEVTSEVVAAYVAKNHIQVSELPALIASVYATLDGLGNPDSGEFGDATILATYGEVDHGMLGE